MILEYPGCHEPYPFHQLVYTTFLGAGANKKGIHVVHVVEF